MTKPTHNPPVAVPAPKTPAASVTPVPLVQRKYTNNKGPESHGDRTEPRFEHHFGQISVQRFPSVSMSFSSPQYTALEREADQVANRVLTAPTTLAVSSVAPRIQRYTKQAGPVEKIPASVHQVLNNSGRPLEPALRQDMEQRFGHHFSQVRVHSDANAEQSARELNAHAYTVGSNIVFGAGQYAPATYPGRRILAHELTHVIQQRDSGWPTSLQAEFAIEPTAAAPKVATLSAADITAAITFNQARFTDPTEIALIRDILGLSRTPSVIDNDFIEAVVRYQASYKLDQDGKLGTKTVEQLGREVIAEGTFLGAGNLGSLAPEFGLRDDLQALVDAGNTTYADYKTRILAATPLQKSIALLHQNLLTNMRNRLAWNNFARCVELLGRLAHTYWQLLGETVVRAAVRAAWNDSNVAVPGPGTTQHEEGGWVYLNLITGALTTRRAARGAGAAILLTAPPLVADSIVIAKFHTHPNLGPLWVTGPSDFPPAGPGLPRTGDVTVDAAHGVPDIIAGTNGVDPARFDFFQSGPDRRHHLAGNRGLPGAAGGLAPQRKRKQTFDA